jgi:hypothetical protein
MKGTLGQYKRMRGGYACLNHLLHCTSIMGKAEFPDATDLKKKHKEQTGPRS